MTQRSHMSLKHLLRKEYQGYIQYRAYNKHIEEVRIIW